MPGKITVALYQTSGCDYEQRAYMHKIFDLRYVSANERQDIYKFLDASNIDYEVVEKTRYSADVLFGGSNSAVYVKTKEEQRNGLEIINEYQSSLSPKGKVKVKTSQSQLITKSLIIFGLLALFLSSYVFVREI